MSWQKKARFAIAIFVVVFVIIVVMALRRGKTARPGDAAVPARIDPKAAFENPGGFDHKHTEGGKVVWAVKAGTQLTYADGRTKLGGGVEVESRRGDRIFKVTAKEADVVQVDGALKTGRFTGDVKLTTEDGLLVTAAEATYDDAEGIVRVPGAVDFRKERLKGSGVGATYDRNRDVLWLLDKARVNVSPDEKGGGALEADAKAIGLARSEHYLRMIDGARIVGDGRTVRADEITVHLTEDDQHVRQMLARGNSRIDGGAGGPQTMTANDIDLTYAEDGKALEFAKLMQNAVVQLRGVGKSPGRRVAGAAIDIALAPDGTTVTNLTATEKVQLDLPVDGDIPARRIRADSLVAGGTPAGGLQEATFNGNVDYLETRAARPKLPAVNRTARSLRLIVKTQPGLGALQQADFHGNVHFTDGANTKADSPFAVYRVANDRIDLSPSEDPGQGPIVSDGRVEVQARTIEFTLTTRSMKADTKVRSTVMPQKSKTAASEGGRVPALLASDEPVTVTSNRLEYDGAASRATYSGNAALWQKETNIFAGTIVLDDKTGNLTAREKVQTKMMVEHTDSKTKERKRVEQTARAEAFEYDDAKRTAVYTTGAKLTGPEGEIGGDRIEIFLKEKESALDRLEAYGKVTFKEGFRTGTGARLTYTAAEDHYLMIGTPVEVTEMEAPNCRVSAGTTFNLYRATGRTTVTGAPYTTKKIACGGQP